MRRSIEELLEGTENVKAAKFVKRNTLRIIYNDGRRAIRLHDTDIITEYPDSSSFKLDSGGWRTKTTANRINSFIPTGTLFEFRGRWLLMLGGPDDPYEFKDGMTIRVKNGKIEGVFYED